MNNILYNTKTSPNNLSIILDIIDNGGFDSVFISGVDGVGKTTLAIDINQKLKSTSYKKIPIITRKKLSEELDIDFEINQEYLWKLHSGSMIEKYEEEIKDDQKSKKIPIYDRSLLELIQLWPGDDTSLNTIGYLKNYKNFLYMYT